MKKILVVLLIIFGVMLIIAPDRAKDSSPIEKTLGILEKNNKSLRRFVLENGMTCLIKEDHSAPVVSIQFWIGTGSIHEQEYLGSGLSHAIEHMIFKGTPTRKPGDITREINDVGGYINAYTSYDRTVFHTDLPSRNWKTGLATLSDALINTLFPEEEWNKEKEVILREIAMGKDDPDRVLSKLLFQTAYTVHPYKYPVIGYEDTLKAISRDDLVSFFRRNYVSDNVILVIVGDINQEDVEKEIAVTFAEFKRQSRNPAVLSAEPEQVSPRFLREYGEYKKSRLEWVYHTVGLSNPDAPALDVLAEIVGQGRSSRLVNGIKEQQKLVHSISAWSYTPREPGLFGISAELDPEKENQTIEAIQP